MQIVLFREPREGRAVGRASLLDESEFISGPPLSMDVADALLSRVSS